MISYWVQSSGAPALPHPVHVPEHAEVVIIGGGIVGLTAATELSDAGFGVMVLEADALGRGVTAQSTAKVTVATGLRVDQIGHRHGVATAREYLTAGVAGMSWIAARADGAKLGNDRSPPLCHYRSWASKPSGSRAIRAIPGSGCPPDAILRP